MEDEEERGGAKEKRERWGNQIGRGKSITKIITKIFKFKQI